MGDEESRAEAKLVEEKDLDEWTSKNFLLYGDWQLFMAIVEGQIPADARNAMRESIAKRTDRTHRGESRVLGMVYATWQVVMARRAEFAAGVS